MRLTTTIILASLVRMAAFATNDVHTIAINQTVSAPDEGLLLGNGDLSVSVYQSTDYIVFRLGKGDVWDRRLQTEGAGSPVTNQEYIDGVLRDGWRVPNWSGNGAVATVTNNPARFAEVFGGGELPLGRPYPMPKPTGELRMRLPMDMPGPMSISQRLLIEEGRILIDCSWTNGVVVKLEAVIPYDENVLAVRWAVSGWDDWTRVGSDATSTPIRFVLTRWKDPPFATWVARLHAQDGMTSSIESAKKYGDAATLPAPTAFMLDGNVGCIEQRFYEDNLFPEGFSYRLTLASPSCGISAPDISYDGSQDAWLFAKPYASLFGGSVMVSVTTSRDGSLTAKSVRPFEEYRQAAISSARNDWAKRALSFPSDPALERLWYSTCHARRCILRGGTVPPGLFFPSTIGDYCFWHGDYHSNYNMEAIYWGAFAGNQLDQMQAYFDCVDFYRPIGRKIARDYYGCRGCFIQLEGFPLLGDDDHHGYLPLGRMTYMTGWLMEPYWRWYRYTMDREWLESRGYPFIKECALFYLDYLKQAPNADLPPALKDGKYHAFPSVHGEAGWSSPMDVCDQQQVLGHVRFCLHKAILAARELGVDAELRDEWQTRLDNLAGTSGTSGCETNLARHCSLNAEPEFGGSVPTAIPEWDGTVHSPETDTGFSGSDYWYAGQSLMYQCAKMRTGTFVPERDFPFWRKRIDKWARPNGLIRAMALCGYGHIGAWTESLCAMSSFEESLLQSWDGSIRLFPNWRGADVSFENWLAEGAFRVSAAWKDGKVASVTIVSEKGGSCVLSGNWNVADSSGDALETDLDPFGRQRFNTVAGGSYALTPVPAPAPVVRAVANDARVAFESGESVQAETRVSSASYPQSVGEPLFWLDCADTNGWRFVDGTDGVSYIPSRAGSKTAGVRHLSTSSDGGDWSRWSDGTPIPPCRVSGVAELGGGAMLDFGVKGSRMGLMFNPDPAMADEKHPGGYNALTNIGTIVSVWGSARSGGHFLGGGAHYDYGWHRGQGMRTGGSFDFASCLVNGNAQIPVRNGFGYHDGFKTCATLLGMNGAWQTLSLSCASATAEATGFGIADKRSSMSWVSGGQQVAEVLIYDRVLSDLEIAAVERYLERKWFSRGRPGWDGDARLGELRASCNNTTIPVVVPAGETLEIGFVAGGSQADSKLVKKGGGALKFAGEGARHYAADIVVKDGTLQFPTEAEIPTPDELPHHLYARFDASASVVTDAEGRVTCWSNLVAGACTAGVRPNGTLTKALPFALHAPTAAQRPSFVPDAFGEGLPAVDFGKVASVSAGGRCLVVCTNQTANADESCGCTVALRGVSTVIAALEPHDGGGSLVDMRPMLRRSPSQHTHRSPTMHADISSYAKISASEGDVWMDGIKWSPSDGYRLAGPQVAAFRTVGGNVTRVMCSSEGGWCGGSRIGELLIWDRALTDDEMRSASAYLAAKWFRRHVPGHRRPAGAFDADDIQRLVVDRATEIHVGKGRTVRIGRLQANADIVKTGEGTLCIGHASYAGGAKTTAKEGMVAWTPTRTCETGFAGGAAMHVDATDAASMILETGNFGEKTLVRWNDVARGIGLWSYSTARRPYLNEDSDAACNGMPVVDFGGFGSGATGVGNSGGGRWMVFDRPLYAIRSIFAVVGFQRGGGFLFSNTAGNPCGDVDDITFHAGYAKGADGNYVYSGASGLFQGYQEQKVFEGGMYTNGVVLAALSTPISTNGYFLLELHPSSAVQAAQIARDRSSAGRMGGFRVGELLVYERELTDSEKASTRDYLMKKWFGKATSVSCDAVSDPGMAVSGKFGATTDRDVAMARLTGTGEFSKSGGGTLAIDDLSGFTGTVAVVAGTLRVNGSDTPAGAGFVSEGVVYHADATRGILATTNAEGQVCVKEWASQAGGSVAAVSSGGDSSGRRLVCDPSLDYLPAVVMDGYNACFRWQDTEWRTWKNIAGIRSVFWVVGSQDGGGFLLGGGTNETGSLTYYWHRGIHYSKNPDTGKMVARVGTTNVCHILHSGACKELHRAHWRVNGMTIDPLADGLSGGWDVVSMVVTNDDYAANADGLAFDGRSRLSSGATNHGYNGHQRLAEVIVYNRSVTDDERAKIENYLRGKWLLGMHGRAENVSLDVAGGAMAVLGGSQRYHALAGAGTVCGDLCLDKLVADAAATEWPTVDGTLTLADPVEIEIRNRAVGDDKPIRILACGDIRGLDPASGLFVSDGILCLQPAKVGTIFWYTPK